MTRASTIQPPRGTQDVLPADWQLRHLIIDSARSRFERAGFGRISTPTFEHTELFHRGVGETTDIVGKETYTFDDRGGRSLTLRPEGTAGVSRAFVTHGMHREPLPVKLWYSSSMFRYEKPQAGRLREHEQIGAEALGSEHPAVDAELIALQAGIFADLGIASSITLHVNSIGSGDARAAYRDALVAYLTPRADELDHDSRDRLATNPLRILDSKDPGTRTIVADAPRLPEFLTDADHAHFDAVCGMLDAAGIDHVVDPLLVRGLDYYTRTVWEFASTALGAQSAVGAGGRYDGLVETLGGPATPAVGFGAGIERLMLVVAATRAAQVDASAERPRSPDAFVGVRPEAGDAAWRTAFRITTELRQRGRAVELELGGRSVKGQLKQAARLGIDIRVLVDDLGARMFVPGDPTGEGVDLPADVVAAIGQVDAQLAAAGA